MIQAIASLGVEQSHLRIFHTLIFNNDDPNSETFVSRRSISGDDPQYQFKSARSIQQSIALLEI